MIEVVEAVEQVAVGQVWADGLNPGDFFRAVEVDGLDRVRLALIRDGVVVSWDFMRWPTNRWPGLVQAQRLVLIP